MHTDAYPPSQNSGAKITNAQTQRQAETDRQTEFARTQQKWAKNPNPSFAAFMVASFLPTDVATHPDLGVVRGDDCDLPRLHAVPVQQLPDQLGYDLGLFRVEQRHPLA